MGGHGEEKTVFIYVIFMVLVTVFKREPRAEGMLTVSLLNQLSFAVGIFPVCT